MEVLHVFKAIYPDSVGGIEKVIQVLSNGLYAEHGIKSTVLGVSKNILKVEVIEKHQGAIKVISIPVWFSIGSMPVPKLRPFVKEYVKALKIVDIVHYHFPWPIGDLLDQVWNRKNKTPSVVTYQSDVVKQRFLMVLYRPLMNIFLKSVDEIVVASENYLNSSSVLKKYRSKITVIPNGLPKITLCKDALKLREAYNGEFERGYFLFIGAPRYYKGLRYLIEAAKGAKFDVVIAGAGVELDFYIQSAKNAQIENVHFVGKVSDQLKSALLHGCLALVLPSVERSEAYGLVLVEALSAGKPLISTQLGTGTSFVNQHEITGIVVPPKDSQVLQKAMMDLMDVERNKQFTAAALERYEIEFTDTLMVDEYRKMYLSLLA